MRLSLPEYNIVLIDFQDIHKKYEKDLLDDIHNYQLMDSLVESQFSNKDIKKLLFHHTIKNCVEYINKVNSKNKVVLYFNNTQFYESEILKYIDEKDYLKLLTNLLIKIRNLLPIKTVISHRSLMFFKELIKNDDGRAKGTVLKIYSTLQKFKIENFTFARVKKFAKKYDLTFLSNEYFNNIKTKQLLFK